MLQLRPYQLRAVDQIRARFREGNRRVLLVSPTGSGKTCLFAHIVAGARAKGKRVWILAHRAELIGQISSALAGTNTPHGFIANGYPAMQADVQVCSVQTLIHRLSTHSAPDLIVQDEAHHLASANSWGVIHGACPGAHVLGVTATPVRLDGHGLSKFFDVMVLGPTTRELIDQGYLAPLRVFAPAQPDLEGVHRRAGDYVNSELAAAVGRPVITGSAVKTYQKHAAGRRAIVFCVSIEHAQAVAGEFRAAGYASQCIDGSMDRQLRARALAAFADGSVPVTTSCDLVSEGFDLPAIECAISLRPTMSLGLWLQQVGRALRPSPGKTHALLLDHAGNTLRLGLPTDDHEWSLSEGLVAKKKTTASVRVCPSCFAASPARAAACVECGNVFPVTPREIEHVDGELAEFTADQARKTARLEQGALKTLESLTALGRQRGYRAPEAWARHIINGRQAKRSL